MRKIHLEPMIKRPAEPGRDVIVIITIVLSIVFALTMGVVVKRAIEYDTYLKHERV